MSVFESVLVANRGEIAVRVLRTARRLGIRSIAVYSDADRDALHVQMADEAVYIGAAPARDSYLNGARVLEAARSRGASAIHPGYGFLSENADFAEACANAGVKFVGPPVAAIRAMGSKSESKRIMASAGVPLVPGYHGSDQSDALLGMAAARIGWPVLVKASAGGGGKGMRIVRDASELGPALAGARREAKAAFGDATLLLEKYLERPRHVEVQVFADTRGGCVALFDRDCSLQRRHQKIIEEAPAPGLPEELRARMAAAAVAAARAVSYEGAGTIEFLVADGEFFFIEMNTRLQVEHPVTEFITGVDLVEWQLRVAAGEAMPLTALPARPLGHAFEARLYAEDPARDFLPASGRLEHLRMPPVSAQCRIDSGVREGDVISVHYDPMIAKIIVHGADRAAALSALHQALAEVEVAGVATNAALLSAITGNADFAAATLETGFIERHQQALASQYVPPALPDAAARRAAGLAAIGLHLNAVRQRDRDRAGSAEPHSPWLAADGWRGLLPRETFLKLRAEATTTAATVRMALLDGCDFDVFVDDAAPMAVRRAKLTDGALQAVVDGRQERVVLHASDSGLEMLLHGLRWRWQQDTGAQGSDGDGAVGGAIRSPMPGTVVEVLVAEGQAVQRGAPLMVVEAMKMEHTLRAPADGVVRALRFAAGARVSESDELLVLE